MTTHESFEMESSSEIEIQTPESERSLGFRV